ncbi:MAG: WD40/YVTN/BNR-like repeat-containing protein, partial [Rhodothermales bacterium]
MRALISIVPSRACILVALGLFFPSLVVHAQQTPPEQRLQWYEQHEAMKEQSLFKNLEWQFLGPTNISGRMTDVDVVAPKGENYTMYVAGASGGVWRTVNEGITWDPVFEHAPSTSIGDVTIAPSDPNVVWIGTGEANIFRSSMAGAGVYKSSDAGESWQYRGLAGTHTIPRILIHPDNPDIVYVAASGHEWTDNEERGVYKTTDGGATWEKALYIDEKTGAIDLVMDPTDPNTLYAATWQRIRKKWNDPRNEPDYTGSVIYRTTDGAATWTEITNGLPEARFRGRIGIDIARSNPNVLYAFVDNYEIARAAPEGETDSYGRPRGGVIRGATVYRTDDRGEHWRQVSETNEYMERLSATYGWVFGQMRVDPNDEDKIYVMGLALNVSEDGGKTFRRLRGMHGDHHGLWIDPDNSDYLVNVNDGGLAISYDGGENWRTFYDNLPLVQFFNVNYDMDEPFHVYGSIQDHGSRRGVVDLSRGRHQIPAVEWEGAPGGEGSNHAVDPTEPSTVYS